MRRPTRRLLIALAVTLALGMAWAAGMVYDIGLLVNTSLQAPRSPGTAGALLAELHLGMAGAEVRGVLDRHGAHFTDRQHALPIPGLPDSLTRLIPWLSSSHTLMADFRDGHLMLTTDEADALAGFLYRPAAREDCPAAFDALAARFATRQATPGVVKAEHVIWPAPAGGVVFLSVRTAPLCKIMAGTSRSEDAAGCDAACHRKG